VGKAQQVEALGLFAWHGGLKYTSRGLLGCSFSPKRSKRLATIVDPGNWTTGLDRMPRFRPGDRRGKKDV
jgi:hypothetical protein